MTRAIITTTLIIIMAILTGISQRFSADALDVIHFVDVSDTSQDPAGSSYKIRKQEFLLEYANKEQTTYFQGATPTDYLEMGVRRTVSGADPTIYLNVTSDGSSFLGRYDGISETRGIRITNSGIGYFNGTSFVDIPVAGDYLSTTTSSYIDGGTGYRELGVIREVGGIDITSFINTGSDGSTVIGNYDGTTTTALIIDDGVLNFSDSSGISPVALANNVLLDNVSQYAQADTPTDFLELGVQRTVSAQVIQSGLSIDTNQFAFLARRNTTTGDPQTGLGIGQNDAYFFDGTSYQSIYHTGNLPAGGGLSVDVTTRIKKEPHSFDDFTGYTDFYATGTVSIDTTEYIDHDQSVKIVAASDTGFTGMSSGALSPTRDYSDSSFRVWVKSDDWANVQSADLLFSTDGVFSSFYYYNIMAQVLYTTENNDTWMEIVFNKSDLLTFGSNLDLSAVNQVALRVSGTVGNTPTVYFNGLQVIEESKSPAVVTVTFDDNWESDLTEAKEYMDNYGFRGTSFVIVDEIGISNKLTQDQIDEMAHAGWEIGGHGGTNLLTLTEAQRASSLEQMKNYLNTYGYKGSNHYAYPNGGYNEDVMRETRQYFGTARTIDGIGQPMNNITPMKVYGRTITPFDTPATIQGWIDEAIANGQWLNLVFHRIIPSGATLDTEYNRADFRQVMDYLDSSGVLVLPYDEAYQYLKNANESSEAGIGAAQGISDNLVFVDSKTDLPTAIGGVITLAADTNYFITSDIDLTGDRIVCPTGDVAIIGTSSETASITSTGLAVSTAMITATHSMVLQNVTFKDVDTLFDIDGTTGGSNVAFDWQAFNIENVPNIGTMANFNNNIWTTCAILNSAGLVYTGTMDTVAFNNSLMEASTGGTVIEFDASAVVSRRFRTIYSSFVVLSGETGINFNASATVPVEAYILDTVNFAGGGTYITGIDHTSNKSLFSNCVGITNSREISNYYMNGNSTATTVASTGVAYKVAGTTTSNTVTQKFTNSTTNRATYDGAITRFFKITATISVESGNNNQIGVYLAKNGTLLTESEVYGTTNGSGRAENIVVQALVELSETDYIEVFVENDTATQDITATDLNVIIQ